MLLVQVHINWNKKISLLKIHGDKDKDELIETKNEIDLGVVVES